MAEITTAVDDYARGIHVFRSYGAANIAEFYEAFDVDTDSPFYLAPEDRVTIW